MKKLLIAVFVGIPLVGCTEEIIVKKAPGSETPAEAQPGESTGTTEPPPGEGGQATPGPTGPTASPDRCLDGQDMNAADVDVKSCPPIPEIPENIKVGKTSVGLGAWELGTTSEGDTYVYGSLTAPASGPRVLEFDGGSVAVNAENVECWAKGYYRLRKILQDPPAEWLALKDAGFQYRFFQFQTDLRNGTTGYKQISSFQDHLVKWVTVVDAKGACQQPTLAKFKAYAKSELTRRGLPVPGGS